MPRERRWSEADLRGAVAESTSMREICTRLGLRPGGGTYATLRGHVTRLGIDDDHLPRLIDGRMRRRRSWTDADLVQAVEDSSSIAEVLRRLGFTPNGGTHRLIKGHIRRLGVSTDHFLGQGWARGRPFAGGVRARPLDEILVAKSTYTSTGTLRRRLIAAGLKPPRCERCGLDRWQGEPLPLALDHINGDPNDNRLQNLRILCPNCHALTDTWCGRNKGPAYSNRQRDIA